MASGAPLICTTATDEAGKQRQVCSDAMGGLVKVLEPNPASTATNATGSVTVSGTEQSGNSQPATSGQATITISGQEQSAVTIASATIASPYGTPGPSRSRSPASPPRQSTMARSIRQQRSHGSSRALSTMTPPPPRTQPARPPQAQVPRLFSRPGPRERPATTLSPLPPPPPIQLWQLFQRVLHGCPCFRDVYRRAECLLHSRHRLRHHHHQWNALFDHVRRGRYTNGNRFTAGHRDQRGVVRQRHAFRWHRESDQQNVRHGGRLHACRFLHVEQRTIHESVIHHVNFGTGAERSA